MSTYRRILSVLLVVGFFLVGCEHADPLDPNRIEPTLSSIQMNIFDLNCALSGCHAGASPQLGMDLSEGQAHSSTVNVQSVEIPSLFRIAPGDPDNSYLVWKIEGRPEIVGAQMPRGRAPLSQEQIDVIRQWITDGAQDN